MLLRETESIRLAVITFFLLGWLQRMYPHRQGIEIKFLPIQRILVIGCSQPIERFSPAGHGYIYFISRFYKRAIAWIDQLLHVSRIPDTLINSRRDPVFWIVIRSQRGECVRQLYSIGSDKPVSRIDSFQRSCHHIISVGRQFNIHPCLFIIQMMCVFHLSVRFKMNIVTAVWRIRFQNRISLCGFRNNHIGTCPRRALRPIFPGIPVSASHIF